MFISDLLPSMGGSIEYLVQTTAVKKFMKLHSLVIQSIRKTNKQTNKYNPGKRKQIILKILCTPAPFQNSLLLL